LNIEYINHTDLRKKMNVVDQQSYFLMWIHLSDLSHRFVEVQNFKKIMLH